MCSPTTSQRKRRDRLQRARTNRCANVAKARGRRSCRHSVKPAPFEYFSPTTVEELVSLLGQHGDEAKLLAGGQSLIALLALRLATPSVVIDLNRVAGLDYLSEDGDAISVGALARHRAVEKRFASTNRCPMVSEAVGLIGHVAIRNRGTVVGSVIHADPAAEWPALALALEGECDVVGPQGKRTIPAEQLFVTYFTTTLSPDEVATELRIKLPPARMGSAFTELSRRHGDFAIAGAGAVLGLDPLGRVDDARIVLIGVADTAMRIGQAEDVLVGREPSSEGLTEAAEIVGQSIDPAGDVHGSSEFRKHVTKVLTRRALEAAAGRARGGSGREQA
jgi:aerobic carbon-monoxide dehydrogenase medium subunit